LNKLSDEKLIVQFTGKKLVLLTEAGKQLAKQLKKKLKIQ
jgi:Mn-dependent DtxR family transcriptional regulator